MAKKNDVVGLEVAVDDAPHPISKLTAEGQARVDQLTEAYRKLESYLDDRLPASSPEREEARLGLSSSLQSAVAAVWVTEGWLEKNG